MMHVLCAVCHQTTLLQEQQALEGSTDIPNNNWRYRFQSTEIELRSQALGKVGSSYQFVLASGNKAKGEGACILPHANSKY